MVDRERISERLAHMDRRLARLERVRAQGEDAYLEDEDRRLITERALQVALQACIDVGAHLVRELKLGSPSDSRSVFGLLADGGVIPAELADRLREAAGLRNVLVHDYAELDDRKVFDALD